MFWRVESTRSEESDFSLYGFVKIFPFLKLWKNKDRKDTTMWVKKTNKLAKHAWWGMFCCGWWLMLQWLVFHRCPLCRVTSGRRMIKSQEQDVRSLSYSIHSICVMCNDRYEYSTKAMRSYGFKTLRHSRLQNRWFDTRGYDVDNNGPRDWLFKGIKCHKCLIFVYFSLENISLTFLQRNSLLWEFRILAFKTKGRGSHMWTSEFSFMWVFLSQGLNVLQDYNLIMWLFPRAKGSVVLFWLQYWCWLNHSHVLISLLLYESFLATWVFLYFYFLSILLFHLNTIFNEHNLCILISRGQGGLSLIYCT